ncbi:RepA leader peptide Tap [Salmonella enterica subsp. enterica serovar Newport]|nr:RepA leader peptide Tap [Salmonella enterica]EDB4569312.1 RepA leader peptide Tap [Salmonella enterica subsp. enterica serovar Panama]EHC9819285.1 RepA leader peptide Tap [Salmonella enterica subsp. enterica serovar Newport]
MLRKLQYLLCSFLLHRRNISAGWSG